MPSGVSKTVGGDVEMGNGCQRVLRCISSSREVGNVIFILNILTRFHIIFPLLVRWEM